MHVAHRWSSAPESSYIKTVYASIYTHDLYTMKLIQQQVLYLVLNSVHRVRVHAEHFVWFTYSLIIIIVIADT